MINATSTSAASGRDRAGRTASNTDTGYGRSIGRVVALAIALGLGAALATLPWVAWASPEGDSSTDTHDTSSTLTGTVTTSTGRTNASTGASLSPPPSSPVSANTTTGAQTTTAGNQSTTASAQTSTTTPTTLGGENTPSVVINAQTNTSEPTSLRSGHTRLRPAPELSAHSAQTAQRKPDLTVQASPPRTPADMKTAATLGLTPSLDASVASPISMTKASQRFTEAATTHQFSALSALDAPTQALTPPPADPIRSLGAVPATLINAAVRTFVSFFEPVIGPGAPFDSPALWAVLAFARRETNHTWANQTSTLSVSPLTSQDLDGGTLTVSVPAAVAVPTVFTLPGAFGVASSLPPFLMGQVTTGNTVVPINYNNWLLYPDDTDMIAAATLLNEAITSTPGPKVVFAHSLGAVVSYRWLHDFGPTSSVDPAELSFVLVGNSVRRYGGLLSVLGLAGDNTIPPDNRYRVTDMALQYDGWADFPTLTSNAGYLTALFNALQGQNTIHPFYENASLEDPGNLTFEENNVTYVLAPTALVPLAKQWYYTPSQQEQQDELLRPQIESAYDRPESA